MVSTGIRYANRSARVAETDQGILVFVQKFCAHDQNRSDYQAWVAGLSRSRATKQPRTKVTCPESSWPSSTPKAKGEYDEIEGR